MEAGLGLEKAWWGDRLERGEETIGVQETLNSLVKAEEGKGGSPQGESLGFGQDGDSSLKNPRRGKPARWHSGASCTSPRMRI